MRINPNNYFQFGETDRIVEGAQHLAEYALGDIEECVHSREHNWGFRKDSSCYDAPSEKEWDEMAEEQWAFITPQEVERASFLSRPITVREMEIAYNEFITYYKEEGSSRVDAECGNGYEGPDYD